MKEKTTNIIDWIAVLALLTIIAASCYASLTI